jgi:hypothetical protein
MFNPVAGFIIAEENFSPAYYSPEGPVTPLSKWSDVIFVIYDNLARQAGVPTSNLNMIIQYNIHNKDTETIVATAVQQSLGKPLGRWPGITFLITSDLGKAILGSPNGQGVGWLLAQHKSAFGSKTVSGVTAWRRDTALNLVFYLTK